MSTGQIVGSMTVMNRLLIASIMICGGSWVSIAAGQSGLVPSGPTHDEPSAKVTFWHSATASVSPAAKLICADACCTPLPDATMSVPGAATPLTLIQHSTVAPLGPP